MDPEADVPPALPPKPRLSRPRITIPSLTIPIPYAPRSPGAPMTAGGPPLTAGCAVPIGNINGPFGLMHMYPSKASEFMFRRYEGFKDFTRNTAKSGLSFGEKWSFWFYGRVRGLSRKWFTHIFLFLVVFLYSVLGAMLFVSVEGTHEDTERADIAREFSKFSADVRRMADEGRLLADRSAWDSRFQEVFQPYQEQLLDSFNHGVTPGELKRWSFWNSVFYCGTIYTTIGYGHISPVTATGRAITIVYAIFGIPMFLILLADFGKLFTRGIKFLWAFVRRLYYTGSCKKVRRTGPVQDIMKGMQLAYDFARRSSQMPPDPDGQTAPPPPSDNFLKPPDVSLSGLPEATPDTPAPSQFEIDDEFNLPISVAISILVGYIFVGATIYCMWEEWSFFESFYFVFISMSTIGFGDYVPHHPMYMMASMVYLVFGLALTSMCINVVQEKLSDTFRQASAKIGATIGLHVAEEDVTVTSAPAELADVNPDFAFTEIQKP